MRYGFELHATETAPEAAQTLMQAAEEQFGFVPNLLKALAEAPAVLETYLKVTEFLAKSSLSDLEQQIVLLTASTVNECHYCIPAHSPLAKQAGLSDEDLAALTSGEAISDGRFEALRQFTIAIVERRGNVPENQLQTFIDAGYSRQSALEVILGVSLKTLSNYTNALIDTPVDEQFQK